MTIATGSSDTPESRQSSTIVLFVSGDPSTYVATVRDFVERSDRHVVVAASDDHRLAPFAALAVEQLIAPSAAAAAAVLVVRGADLFVVDAPVVLPDDAISRAEQLIAGDLRVATVSFFSNDAGPLSFPDREPHPTPPAGFDARSLTARLRSVSPEVAPCPVPYAAGGAVLLSAVALAFVGSPVDGPPGTSFDVALADFSLRCRERGFFDLLDPATFVFRPATPGITADRPVLAETGRAWLEQRHPQLLAGFARESRSPETPLAMTTNVSRVKAVGLRVLIDDTTLGPFETGAQITTLAIIRGLAERDDVAEVGVALGHHIPPYARDVLGLAKVNPRLRSGADYGEFTRYDVLHRTTQPDKDFSVIAARERAQRVVVSILDLIAYRAGSYHTTGDEWVEYREALRSAVRAADGVTTISEDVAAMLALEQLPVERDRLFPVLYGTEHLSGAEPAEFPAELATSGHVAAEFVLCLGTDYAHKNRDLAIAVHREVTRRGRDVTLVMAGPSVPFGCSRNAERALLAADADVVFLPDVTSAERNWLLRHATVVLYPTSAEGFGLVPFEAARFGTPTVSVRFGPLLETSADLPVSVASWDVGAFADAVDLLLCDPHARSAQVDATLRAADRYSWSRTVDEFLVMYRELLARPSRSLPRSGT